MRHALGTLCAALLRGTSSDAPCSSGDQRLVSRGMGNVCVAREHDDDARLPTPRVGSLLDRLAGGRNEVRRMGGGFRLPSNKRTRKRERRRTVRRHMQARLKDATAIYFLNFADTFHVHNRYPLDSRRFTPYDGLLTRFRYAGELAQSGRRMGRRERQE